MSLSKTKITIISFMLLFFCSNAVFSQTQLDLNVEACDKYKKADAELNKIYRQILTEYKSDKLFLQKMKQAQNAWIKFRDASLEARFPLKPNENSNQKFGSVYPMCECLVLMEITEKRTEELKQWTDGIEEGEVCSGSIKIKENDTAQSEYSNSVSSEIRLLPETESYIKSAVDLVAVHLNLLKKQEAQTPPTIEFKLL